MASVTVRGAASRDVAPDRLHLQLALDAEAARPEAAMDDLARRSATLDRVLDDAGDAVLLRRPSSVWVSPRYDYDGRRHVLRAYAATRAVVVELRPGEGLGPLIRQVVDEAGATVGALRWRVDDDSPAHVQVRAAAAADGRGRAEAYASELGMRLGVLDWIAEPGLGPSRRREDAPGPGFEATEARALAASASGEPDGRIVLDLRAEPVVISASVEVSYTLLPEGPGEGRHDL